VYTAAHVLRFTTEAKLAIHFCISDSANNIEDVSNEQLCLVFASSRLHLRLLATHVCSHIHEPHSRDQDIILLATSCMDASCTTCGLQLLGHGERQIDQYICDQLIDRDDGVRD